MRTSSRCDAVSVARCGAPCSFHQALGAPPAPCCACAYVCIAAASASAYSSLATRSACSTALRRRHISASSSSHAAALPCSRCSPSPRSGVRAPERAPGPSNANALRARADATERARQRTSARMPRRNGKQRTVQGPRSPHPRGSTRRRTAPHPLARRASPPRCPSAQAQRHSAVRRSMCHSARPPAQRRHAHPGGNADVERGACAVGPARARAARAGRGDLGHQCFATRAPCLRRARVRLPRCLCRPRPWRRRRVASPSDAKSCRCGIDSRGIGSAPGAGFCEPAAAAHPTRSALRARCRRAHRAARARRRSGRLTPRVAHAGPSFQARYRQFALQRCAAGGPRRLLEAAGAHGAAEQAVFARRDAGTAARRAGPMRSC